MLLQSNLNTLVSILNMTSVKASKSVTRKKGVTPISRNSKKNQVHTFKEGLD